MHAWCIFTFWVLLRGRDLCRARSCRTQAFGSLLYLEDVVWNIHSSGVSFKLGPTWKKPCVSNIVPCQEQQKLQSPCSTSHLFLTCSRTALLKPPHWLFSSVARAICLWRKDQLCHLNNPSPSAAPAPGAVCGMAALWCQACRHCLSLSVTLVFPGSQAGWGMTNLLFSFSGLSLSGIKPLPSAMRIKIYWAFRPAVPGETADCCCCCWELVPKMWSLQACPYHKE